MERLVLAANTMVLVTTLNNSINYLNQFLFNIYNMSSTEKKDLNNLRSEAQDSISEANLRLFNLDTRIEGELRKNSEGRQLLLDAQKTRVLLSSAQQYLTQGENAYKLGRLNTLIAAGAAFGFAIVATIMESPNGAAFSGAVAATAYLARYGFLRRADSKYQKAREILGREYLSDVTLNPEALDNYVTELNKIESQGFKIKAEPLEQDNNHIWISAGNEVHEYRIGSVYRDKALLTDLYLAIKIPNVDTIEETLGKFLKSFLGGEVKSEFSCPTWGIVFENDQLYYKAAREVRELALNYAAK